MGKIVQNLKSLRDTRKLLRNNQTKPEQFLWEKLKSKQFHGIKFRRQYSVGRYILDFYSAEYKLGIEIDGDNHLEADQEEYDRIRTEYINTAGSKVIRYTNNEVMNNRTGVLQDLEKKIFAKHKLCN